MISACKSLLYIAVIVGAFITSCSMSDMEKPKSESDVPPSKCVMKFVRQGGYFGIHDEFRIYSDGRVLNSVGETARIPSVLVTKWMEEILPVAAPISREKRSIKSLGVMGRDCYIYTIAVYDRGEARALTLNCTDTYPINKDDKDAVIDIGKIRDTLINLSWE